MVIGKDAFPFNVVRCGVEKPTNRCQPRIKFYDTWLGPVPEKSRGTFDTHPQEVWSPCGP